MRTNEETVQSYGPSWSDVAQAAQELTRVWQCLSNVRMGFPAFMGPGKKFWVEVYAYKVQGPQGTPKDLASVTANWPDPRNRTMPGLLLRLYHELDEKLHAASGVTAVQETLV